MLPYYYPDIKTWVKVHYALEDATGDSLIIEYIDGKPHVYEGKNYTALTNSPVYPLQLKNLKHYDSFGGDQPIPGTDSAPDRFVRASYHDLYLPQATSEQAAAAGMFSVLENASPPFMPFGKDQTKVISTIWRTVSDLTHHIYYFNSTSNLTTVYAKLDKFAMEPGSPVMKLDLVAHPRLSGDVTNKFETVPVHVS
jgi:choloylglycine hydrolase